MIVCFADDDDDDLVIFSRYTQIAANTLNTTHDKDCVFTRHLEVMACITTEIVLLRLRNVFHFNDASLLINLFGIHLARHVFNVFVLFCLLFPSHIL